MKRILTAITVLVIALVTALAVVGCGGDSGTETENGTVVEDQKSAEESADDENGKESPGLSEQERLLYDYYSAIDRQDYEAAYGMCSAKYVSAMDIEQFEAMYSEYIKNVKVIEITLLPEFSTPETEEYRVDFDTAYIKNYPAGSGELPMFHVLVKDPDKPGGWLLDGIGTGP